MTVRDVRIVILGGPRTGKTTEAKRLASEHGFPLLHTDDLIDRFDWSGASAHVAEDWLQRPGPWIIEGVAGARALRKWLAANPDGKPCDRVIVMDSPHVDLTKGQGAMAKGCAKVWGEVRDAVAARGVEVVE